MKTGILIGILLSLGGLFFRNRLALGRDKRKEFNEVATPIYEKLREQERILLEKNSFSDGPNIADFDNLERHLHFWEKPFFRKTLSRYNKHQDENRYFQIRKADLFVGDMDQFIISIRQLTKYTKRQ
jgi:hypothetical protein